jgi:hypothetical protein
MGAVLIGANLVATIGGLSDAQAAAIEAALRSAPAPWHNNLIADIAAALPVDGPPWANSDITNAIALALANVGLPPPFFLGPEVLYAGARFGGGGSMALDTSTIVEV